MSNKTPGDDALEQKRENSRVGVDQLVVHLRNAANNKSLDIGTAWNLFDEAAETLISLLIAEKQSRKVIANETIRQIIEDAHMAGQSDAGVVPKYSNAQSYCNDLFGVNDQHNGFAD